MNNILRCILIQFVKELEPRSTNSCTDLVSFGVKGVGEGVGLTGVCFVGRAVRDEPEFRGGGAEEGGGGGRLPLSLHFQRRQLLQGGTRLLRSGESPPQ